MGSCFLLLGTNLGERSTNLQEVRLHISRALGEIITVSSVYKTAAWGNENQPEFYNQAIELRPFNDATSTLAKIHEIEKTMGRVREEHWGSRVIDIDILLWGKQIIHEPHLIIPHPQLPARRFALTPLAELAPDFLHPVLGKTIQQLLHECLDTLEVSKL